MFRSADYRPAAIIGPTAMVSAAALAVCMLATGRAAADTLPARTAPLVDAPFDRPRHSTDATGLTLTIRDLVFTVDSLDNSENRTQGGAVTAISLGTDVLFAFGKSNLTPAAAQLLHQTASEISARAHGPVTITGYTDSIGTDAVNLPLSQARAAAVLAALQPLVTTPGISFSATGKGAAEPVAPNANPDGTDNPRGRAKNRRVTIHYTTG
jgi:outer membrane protein OmpA-like peptidoglycan-associated protein